MTAKHRFGDLLNGLAVRRVWGDPDVDIADVCYDSRLARPGSLFVALRGGYADGHDYLADAAERGAVAAMVEADSPELSRFTAVALVDDTRAALSPVSAAFFDQPGSALGVIGVTGTDGKTTTTYLIDVILRRAGYRTGMIGTVAVRIGDRIIEHDTRQTTPESLEIQRLLARMRDSGVEWSVTEATSHGLVLHRLDDVPIDIAVVTNITREHLDFHGTIDAYRRAKARLLEAAVRSRDRDYPHAAVLNADDEGARSIAGWADGIPTLWYSRRGANADVVAEDVHLDAQGSTFRLILPSGAADVRLALIGGFNVENALAAAGVAYAVGCSPEQIASGLASLVAVPGRMHRVDAGQPFSVFVDYAHTPDALEKMLRLLRSLVKGRLIAVFGSAGERDRTKRPLQGAVSARLADFSIFTSEDPRFEEPDAIIAEIAVGADEVGAVAGRDYLCIEDRRAAIRAAIQMAGPGDAVLLAGKGHEQCMIYGAERRPWDEAREAAEALRLLGYGTERQAGNEA